MALPSRYGIATGLCGIVLAILLVVIGRGSNTRSEAAASATVTITPPITSDSAAIPAANAELDRKAQLEAALGELQNGATCEDRKRAIAKLVELGETNAVPALEKARTQGKQNACLRAAAGAAIRALNGTI